jgi:pilus assembly protein CpaD
MFRKASTPALIAALALTAGACASGNRAANDSALTTTPTEQFPLEAVTQPEQIALAPHAEGLSNNQRSALAQYAQGWGDNGGGVVTVAAPSAGGEPAKRVAWAAKAMLEQVGVEPGAVRVVAYEGPAGSPVRIAYDRYVAVVPECGRNWQNLSRSADNRPQSNFGCAVSANMAAQILNPRDIAGPRPVDASDATRREVVLGKYRAGEPVSSKPEQAVGRVSTAVQ